jgi:hypothetical protein
MVERQLPKLHTRVRFPSPAHLPMKQRLFRPLKMPKSERYFRHRPFLSFDSQRPRLPMVKSLSESDFCLSCDLRVDSPAQKPDAYAFINPAQQFLRGPLNAAP